MARRAEWTLHRLHTTDVAMSSSIMIRNLRSQL